MARTSYIDIAPEVEEDFWKNITPIDRFTYSRVGYRNTLLSVKRKNGISQRSLLPWLSTLWATLSTEQKAVWSLAGAELNLTNWKFFVQEMAARRVNDISGIPVPNVLHQSWIGQINIVSPATEAQIIQTHPRNYYIKKKVTGTKSLYSPVLITEAFSLPLEISINYKSNLTSQGAGSFAKFYARVWYSYQGVDKYEFLEIPLDFIHDWQNATATLTNIIGQVIGYNLYIHLYNLRGDLFFDNVKAEHNGQNWVRDPFCKDINQGFTRNYYQVSKHWTGLITPPGVLFESVYVDY